jgi:hypothetical protein
MTGSDIADTMRPPSTPGGTSWEPPRTPGDFMTSSDAPTSDWEAKCAELSKELEALKLEASTFKLLTKQALESDPDSIQKLEERLKQDRLESPCFRVLALKTSSIASRHFGAAAAAELEVKEDGDEPAPETTGPPSCRPARQGRF